MLEDYLNYSAAGDQKILNYMLLSKICHDLAKTLFCEFLAHGSKAIEM